MGTPLSDKYSLMITSNSRAAAHIRSVTDKLNIPLNMEYESFNSYRVMQKAVSETGNTVFIRKTIARLIDDHGLPELIILDYRLFLGPDQKSDPDRRKLLRTFFISYVIMMRKEKLPGLRGKFIFLANPEDVAEAAQFQRDPESILDIISTTNEDINNLAKTIRQDTGKFNSIFSIRVVPLDRVTDEIETALRSLLSDGGTDGVAPSSVPGAAPETNGTAPSPERADAGDTPPAVAHLLFRTDESTAYKDNIKVTPDKVKNLETLALRQFYVVGRWEKRNLNEVVDSLQQAMQQGVGGISFKNTDQIVINICNQCTIDGTIISALSKLFNTVLAGYQSKKINVNFKNATILERAPGYIMIKKYIQHVY